VIDAPGPWGTGPFILTEGYSSLDTEQAVITEEPFACTWLPTEDRTSRVRLVANPNYWNGRRGARLEEVLFLNDVSPERALELVCDTEGEVDILTQVPPAQAERVERSEHANLVAKDAVHLYAGVIDRDAEGLPLGDRRAREALNLAVDRDGLVAEVMHGRAHPLGGLTPPTTVTRAHQLLSGVKPHPHDPARAAALWQEAGGAAPGRRLRVGAPEPLEELARKVTADLDAALPVTVELTVYRGDDAIEAQRALIEKQTPHDWDVWLQQQGAQSADAPPLEFHRAFVGLTGEHRAGPVSPEFEALFAELGRQVSPPKLVAVSARIERFVHDQALALFLCAPQSLYAVNRHVDFTAYGTSFELPECEVSPEHWSRR